MYIFVFRISRTDFLSGGQSELVWMGEAKNIMMVVAILLHTYICLKKSEFVYYKNVTCTWHVYHITSNMQDMIAVLNPIMHSQPGCIAKIIHKQVLGILVSSIAAVMSQHLAMIIYKQIARNPCVV